MIELDLKGTKFALMRRSRDLLGESASNWAGMRWVIFRAPESSTLQQSIIKAYRERYPWACFREDLNDISIRDHLETRGLCVAHVELAWNIAQGLAETLLCSEELLSYCDPRQCAVNAEILNAVQSVYTSVALELSQSSPFRRLDLKQQSIFLRSEISQRAQQTYVTPSADLVKLFFLVLDHIHWFAVQRFEDQWRAFGDGPFSIYLNSDEFQTGLTRLNYQGNC